MTPKPRRLEELMFDELRQHTMAGGVGGFLPAAKQVSLHIFIRGIHGPPPTRYWGCSSPCTHESTPTNTPKPNPP